MRARSLAWTDWLARETNLNLPQNTFLLMARTAAEHGDAETVRQLVEDPKRLWFDKQADTRVADAAFGQLDTLPIDTLSGRLPDIAQLMTLAPSEDAEPMRQAVMPTLRNVITELTSRDCTTKGHTIETTVAHLLAVDDPEVPAMIDTLMQALPMTPGRVDHLDGLTKRDSRFAPALAEARAWHAERAELAQTTLAAYMKPYGTARDAIDYPRRWGTENPKASQPIAAAIVDQIPADAGDTSPIETSVAYVHSDMFAGSAHGDILACVRKLTGNPHFAFAEPQFGFAATFENGEDSYAHGRVSVVDANLPEGGMVINLSDERLRNDITHHTTRFLCRIIQAEKNRRSS
jgi:hypothetical protein